MLTARVPPDADVRLIGAMGRRGTHALFAAAALLFIVIRLEGGGSNWYWLWAALSLTVPHLIHRWSVQKRNPLPLFSTELLLAALFQGIVVALMDFRPLPTLAIIAPMTGFVLLGGYRLLLLGLSAVAAGALPMALLAGAHVETEVGPITATVAALCLAASQLGIALMVLRHEDGLQATRKNLDDSRFVDALTGIRNRQYVREVLEPRCEASRQSHDAHAVHGHLNFAFIFIKLGDLGAVNRSHGQQAGDRLLRETAQRLLAEVSKQDIVARWSGNEFFVLVEMASRGHGAQAAEPLLSAIRSPVECDGEPVIPRCNAGVAMFPFNARDPGELDWEEVMALAKLAMRQAVSTGEGKPLLVRPIPQAWTNDRVDRFKRSHDPQDLLDSGAVELTA